MEFLDQVSDCIRKAKQNEDDINYSQALKYYHRAISILLHHKKFGTFTTVIKEQLRNKCTEDLNRAAEKIKKLQKETVQETSTTPILNTDNFLVKKHWGILERCCWIRICKNHRCLKQLLFP